MSSPRGSPSRHQGAAELAESIERKPLPTSIPSPPPAGRIQGAPMTPVTVNIQRGPWAPRPSSAQIENEDITKFSSAEPQITSGQQPPELFMPASAEIPYRARPSSQQRASVISADMPGSRPSSDGSSSHRTRLSNGMPEPINENEVEASVPQLHYFHQAQTHRSSMPVSPSPKNEYTEAGATINRHLTPNSPYGRRASGSRPMSTYSDFGARGRSPVNSPGSPGWNGGRAPSSNSGRSHDARPMSYIDLANVSYPQAPPAPISLDNSQLRSVIGTNASLLSTQKTLEMYRQNVKKTSDSETQYAFAIFLIQAAQEAGLNVEEDVTPRKSSPKPGRNGNSPYMDTTPATPHELLREAKAILQKLADKSYPFAQYYLADGYASGLFNKGKEDYGTAFPLFVAASKHGHAESGYRAALCYEFGWGCRKDPAKAVQFYRQSASKNHPGAMTRLGRACLSKDLGLDRYKEGLKWLKRAAESADAQYNAAPYHLGLLYETGYGDDLFKDEAYAAELFTQAAGLGNADAAYKLGDAYEHGKLQCPRDPALSVHFYNVAAEKGNANAMMALCAWYLIGAEPVLDKDENEAYEWARQAAELGLIKAEYAVGYFTEMGIGCRRDPLEANMLYVKAAEHGDERAKHRLAKIRAAAAGGIPMDVAPGKNGTKIKKSGSGNEKNGQNEKECVVM
ncbi:chitin synthase activator protein [Rutstroemia sp. NJR-2017a BBW]|nr:chitin synthase activator protein [Rutstroemia sp. NJR-2017a BBW]